MFLGELQNIMVWNELKTENELFEWKESSKKTPILLFKHSTRCSISAAAKGRIERKWDDKNPMNPKPVYLDLIAYREVSNKIASEFKIEHQSPQVLLIKDGVCTYHSSHYDIDYNEIVENCQ
jgi:bacillithiol system protein YtxJ